MPRRRLLWTFYYTAVVKEERSQEAKAFHRAPGLKLFWVLEFLGSVQGEETADTRGRGFSRQRGWGSPGADPLLLAVQRRQQSWYTFNWEGAPREKKQNLVEVIYIRSRLGMPLDPALRSWKAVLGGVEHPRYHDDLCACTLGT